MSEMNKPCNDPNCDRCKAVNWLLEHTPTHAVEIPEELRVAACEVGISAVNSAMENFIQKSNEVTAVVTGNADNIVKLLETVNQLKTKVTIQSSIIKGLVSDIARLEKNE